jgi:YVTN family beta-propeller protein
MANASIGFRPVRALLALACLLPGVLCERAMAQSTGNPSRPIDATLLVAHKWGDSVGFYDAMTGRLEKEVPIGHRPHESVLSHDGRRAYFTLYGLDLYTETVEGGRAVAVLDVPSRTKVGEIDLGKYRRPHGIEIGRSGRLFVTCDHPPALVILDPTQKAVVDAIELSDPKSLCHMVVVADDERVAFVANCGTADISVIDLKSRREIQRIPVGGVPMGMALSHDGRTLWATTRTTNGLALIDTESHEIRRIIEITGQPVRVTLTPDGRWLLATLIDSGEVAIVGARDGILQRRLKIGRRVEGLKVDSAGRFGYASAQADDKVVRFSLEDWKPVLEIHTAARPDPLITLP